MRSGLVLEFLNVYIWILVVEFKSYNISFNKLISYYNERYYRHKNNYINGGWGNPGVSVGENGVGLGHVHDDWYGSHGCPPPSGNYRLGPIIGPGPGLPHSHLSLSL